MDEKLEIFRVHSHADSDFDSDFDSEKFFSMDSDSDSEYFILTVSDSDTDSENFAIVTSDTDTDSDGVGVTVGVRCHRRALETIEERGGTDLVHCGNEQSLGCVSFDQFDDER